MVQNLQSSFCRNYSVFCISYLCVPGFCFLAELPLKDIYKKGILYCGVLSVISSFGVTLAIDVKPNMDRRNDCNNQRFFQCTYILYRHVSILFKFLESLHSLYSLALYYERWDLTLRENCIAFVLFSLFWSGWFTVGEKVMSCLCAELSNIWINMWDVFFSEP